MQAGTLMTKQSQADQQSSRSLRSLVILVLVATTVIFSNMYITQPVLPVIGAEFGLSPAQAGLTVSAMVLAIAAASLFYGLLSDRKGRKPVILASVLGLALPTLLCSVAPNFETLVVFRIGQGLLIPGYTAIMITYLQEEFPAGRREMMLGYYVSATVAGGFFGRLAGGVVTDIGGNWRLGFVFFGLLDLAIGWALWRYLPPSQNFKPQLRTDKTEVAVAGGDYVEAGPFQPVSFLVHLRNRRLLSIYIVGFSLMFAFLGLFTYLPYYFSQPPFGLSPLLISSAYIVYLVGMFSATFSARMAEIWGKQGVLKIGFCLMLLGVVLTLIAALPVVLIGLVILCFGMFACQSTATALIGESVGNGGGRGSAVALYQVFFYVGASSGGFVPGLLWQMGGWTPVVTGLVTVLALGMASISWLYR